MAPVESQLGRDDTLIPGTDSRWGASPPEASMLVGYFASFAMTAVATFVAVGLDSEVAVPNVSLVFVIPVIAAGVAFGLGPSLSAALLGALAYNFFLTEPRYTLAVNDPANIWAIGLLFIVGLIVSSIAFTSRRRATDAALLRRQTAALQDYSRDVVAADNMNAIVSITSEVLAALFQVPVVVMFVTDGNVRVVSSVGGAEPREAEYEAAKSSLEMGTVVRAGLYPSLASRFDFWPVAAAAGQRAVIGLAFHPDKRPASLLVDIIASVLALALDRQHS